MARRPKPEEIVSKLRQVDVLVSSDMNRQHEKQVAAQEFRCGHEPCGDSPS